MELPTAASANGSAPEPIVPPSSGRCENSGTARCVNFRDDLETRFIARPAYESILQWEMVSLPNFYAGSPFAPDAKPPAIELAHTGPRISFLRPSAFLLSTWPLPPQ